MKTQRKDRRDGPRREGHQGTEKGAQEGRLNRLFTRSDLSAAGEQITVLFDRSTR